MTSPANQILSTLGSDLTGAGVNASAALMKFFSGALLEWGGDEAKILGDCVQVMIDKRNAGSTWEEAVTAAYNTFVAEETAEGNKIVLEFLNLIASIAKTVEAIF